MNLSLRNMSLAAALLVGTTPFLMTSQAYALSSHDCSVKFKAAQADGTAGAMKYKDFRAAQCAADATAPAVAAAPAAPAAVAVAPAVTPVKVKKVKAPAAAAVAPAAPAVATTTMTTPSGSFMQNCSAAWKTLKASNGVPAGMKWKDFVAAKCVVAGAAAPATPAVAAAPAPKVKAVKVVPAEPMDTTVDTTELKTVDKNGKPFTVGQMAAHKRIRECANQWRTAKAGNTVPAGEKWPQFWSACNTQLKAAGQ